MITKKHPLFNSFFIFTMAAVFMFHGCAKKNPDVLKKKTFAAVLTELMVIEKLGTDEVHKTALTQAVLDSFQVTAEQFSVTTEYYKENPNWKNVAEKLLEQNIDKRMKVVWELMNSNLSVKEQVERFREMTGMSRRTYFRIKAKIENLMGNFGNNF